MSAAWTLGNIIIVDDNAVDMRAATRALTGAGVIEPPVTFTCPRIALDYLIEQGPEMADLILLDLSMPKMNGFQFIDAAEEALGARLHHVVIALLTSSLDGHDRARAIQTLPVREFLLKPLSTAAVHSLIRRYFAPAA